jgi:membrane associated rhomboid family serine protease
MHLFGNLLPLWVFGNHVEDRLGHWRYLIFYVFCGLAASVGHVFSDPTSTLPCVGASGAIAGILGASLLLIPKAWVVTLVPLFFFFRFVRLPAFIFLVIWFAMQILMNYSKAYADLNIAVAAHIVGFLFGFFAILMIKGPQRA